MTRQADVQTWKFETRQLHVGQEQPDPATGSRAVPIYQTAAYVFTDTAQAAARFALEDAGNIYTRLTNTTQDVLEKRMASLEGGVTALALASGAAAITYAFQGLASAGQHIVAAKTLYGGTYNLLSQTLPRYGITTTFVDAGEKDAFAKAIRPETRAVFIETLGNPNATLIDIEETAKVAHAHGVPLVVDSTFTPPCVLRPIEYGADIVVHSATKFLGGHGTTLGGILVDSGRFDWKKSGKFPALTEPNASYHGLAFADAIGPAAFAVYLRATLLRDTGACISPFNAFLLLQGIETLSLRVERHISNALAVVAFLSQNPKVAAVRHPSLPCNEGHTLYTRYFPHGAGSIFTCDIAGGEREARAFIDNLRLFSLLANVADAKSLVIHPASTTHSQLSDDELAEQGIGRNTVRLSIGLEHSDDILDDLKQALEKV